MPFPSTQAATPSLKIAFENLTALAGAIKQRTAGLNATSAAGPVDGAAIVNYLRDLVAARDRMVSLAAVPGLAAYAKTEVNDAALDIAAEYSTMLAQINAAITWLKNNFPKDASGYLLYEQIGGDGTVSFRSFTTAQLATLRTQLTALTATIA